ncbi:SGNH/GDSL hydrolase family protein [Thermodesulfobacteriota bacterium]
MEITSRILNLPQKINIKPEVSNYDWVITTRIFSLIPIEYKPGLYASSHIRGFNLYWRCNEINCKNDLTKDSTRVVCLGGSTTWGDGLNDDETYPAQLGRILNDEVNRESQRFSVINLGIPGLTSYFLVKKGIYDALTINGDIVVIGYGGINDSLHMHYTDRNYRPLYTPFRLLRSFNLYRIIENSLDRYLFYPEPVPRVTKEEFIYNLDASYQFLKEKGLEVIFLTEASLIRDHRYDGYGFSPIKHKEYSASMIEFANRYQIPLIDIEALFKTGSVEMSAHYFLEDGLHWSQAGCNKIARALADVIHRISLY